MEHTKISQKGFTIVELVVVIVVIGILAAVALPRFLGLQDRAHDAVVEGTQAALASGVVMAQSVWLAEGRDSALDNILLKADLTETCVGGLTVNGNADCSGAPAIPAGTAAAASPSLDVNSNGYPVGHTFHDDVHGETANKANTINSAKACTEVFEFLLSDASVKAVDAGGTGDPGSADTGAMADSGFDYAAYAVSGTAALTGLDTNSGVPATTSGCDFVYLPDRADNKSGVNFRFIRYNALNGTVRVGHLSSAGTTSQ